MAAAAAPSFASLAGGRRAVTAAGPGWARLWTPGPLLPARQALGLGHRGSCNPSAFAAAGWGCGRAPGPGIMGNGMTKVGGRDRAARTCSPRARGPGRGGSPDSDLLAPAESLWVSVPCSL